MHGKKWGGNDSEHSTVCISFSLGCRCQWTTPVCELKLLLPVLRKLEVGCSQSEEGIDEPRLDDGGWEGGEFLRVVIRKDYFV